MTQTVARAVALLLAAVIVYATLASIDHRPRTGFVSLEREIAFFLLGLALAVGFPGHFWRVGAGLVVFTCGLELAQNLTPDRHGAVVDALQKLGGGLGGLVVGLGLTLLFAPD